MLDLLKHLKLENMNLESEYSSIFGDSIDNANIVNEFITNQNNILSDFITAVNARKESIIMNRLKELGIEFNTEIEANRRFKNICLETHDGNETYWYNDGSVSGVMIVTFERLKLSDFDETTFRYY